MDKGIKESSVVLMGLGIWFLLQLIPILIFDGTYDTGDSVMHFQYAAYAFDHPANILDQWAKPMFTLLAAPFASLGWVWMKLFQVFLTVLSCWAAYKTGANLGFKRAWAAPFFIAFAPAVYLAQFSGLTEPMFAAMLTCGVWAASANRLLPAAIIWSFLPFVRSEGFVILAAVAPFFVVRRAWIGLLGLGTGTLVWGAIGAIASGSLTWIFSANPYLGELNNYGKGTWTHFLEKYVYVVGLPIHALTALSLVLGVLQLAVGAMGLKDKMTRIWLIYAPFAAYFGLHVVLWANGLGHSFGMTRVMIAIVPLGALIILDAWSFFESRLPRAQKYLQWGGSLVLVYVALFPIFPNPAALKIPRDLQLIADQALAQEMGIWIQQHRDQIRLPLYSSHPAIPMFSDLDPFDSTQVQPCTALAMDIPPGGIVAWDNWFAMKEDGVFPQYWEDNKHRFELLWSQDTTDAGAYSEMRLYRRLNVP